jgi:hypothetical protein
MQYCIWVEVKPETPIGPTHADLCTDIANAVVGVDLGDEHRYRILAVRGYQTVAAS